MTGSPKGPGRTGAIHRGNLQNLVLLDLAPGRLNNTEVIVNAAEAVPTSCFAIGPNKVA